MKKLWTIASMTLREAIHGKILWLSAFFLALMVAFTYLLSHFIHTDDMGTFFKLLADGGLSMLSLGLFILAIFFTFQSVSSDKKNQTLLLSLAMPIKRRDFVMGKFLGIALTLSVMAALFYLTLTATMALFLAHEVEHVGKTVDGWLGLLSQACLGIYASALLQALWTLALCLLLDSEFLMLFASLCIWGLGSLSQDWVHLAEHLSGPERWMPLMLAHVFPDYHSLNYLVETAYQVRLPLMVLGSHLAYVALYGLVLLLLLTLIMDGKDIT